MPKNIKKYSLSTGAALAAATLLALGPAAAASAHVSASATSTAAGSQTVVTFSVPHGCEGSPTTQVRIDLPESTPSATPTVNPNWTVEKTVEKLAEPLEDAHGNVIAERVASVTYTAIGAGLADGYRDAFELSLRLPAGEPGDVVEFPTFQVCVEGSADWVGPEAPAITLTAAVEGDASHHDAGEAAGGESGGDGHEDAAAAAPAGEDTLARVFGVAALALGAAGVVIALLRRRTPRA